MILRCAVTMAICWHIVSHTGNRYDTEVCSNYGYVLAHMVSHTGNRYDTEVCSNYDCAQPGTVSLTLPTGMVLRYELRLCH
jgi:hypothetical protein